MKATYRNACAFFVICAATVVASSAQVFNTLVDFSETNGAAPTSLVQGIDGNLYGTASAGGNSSNCTGGCGTVFKLSLDGTLTTLYTFCLESGCRDGSWPSALLLATDGNFYSTTAGGGNPACESPYGCGTVFKITPQGVLTTLHNFGSSPNDGVAPSGLTQAVDGNFYGTTSFGGTGTNCSAGCGTVFKITPRGALSILHNFDSVDGADPLGRLVQAIDGNFYGTTFYGGGISAVCGASGCGTLYRITAEGNLRTLFNFDLTHGAFPSGGLIEATNKSLYGTASSGGLVYNFGVIFKATPRGALESYGFCGKPSCGDGEQPFAGVIQATDGNLYGTTYGGGESFGCNLGCGTVFAMTPGGALITLHSFNVTDGERPYGSLFQATNGTLYGTTSAGGNVACRVAAGCGTIFSLSIGLKPFVAFVFDAAKTGSAFGILGQGFIGTTSVSFNGIPAAFSVKADTFILATVPVGATTGYVTVNTPGGTLISNKPFYVIP